MEKGLEGNTGLERKVLPKPKADKGMNQSRNNVREGKNSAQIQDICRVEVKDAGCRRFKKKVFKHNMLDTILQDTE